MNQNDFDFASKNDWGVNINAGVHCFKRESDFAMRFLQTHSAAAKANAHMQEDARIEADYGTCLLYVEISIARASHSHFPKHSGLNQ